MDKKTKEEIIKYVNEVYEKYPSIKEKNKIIKEISEYIFELYDNSEEQGYENEISKEESISLAYKIIESINEEYALEFLNLLENKNIIFSDIYDNSFTTIKDGKILSRIFPSFDIEMVVSLVHEFFHILHLKKYDANINSEDFYLYCEGISMGIEIYSILFLINNNIYEKDCKNYLENDFICGLYDESESSYYISIIIEIYNTYHSLSDDVMKKYIIENNLSIDFISYIKNISWRDYLESSRYIFNFPIAYLIGKKMYFDNSWKNKFVKLFNNINQYNIDDLLHELELNYSDDILEQINEDYKLLINKKVKKIGEV